MERANATSWKTKNMPPEQVHFTLCRTLTMQEWEILQQGHIPVEMEDRWFFYTEADKIYFHRSWTGNCIFIVQVETQEDGTKVLTDVTVNQNKNEYTETDLAKCKERLQLIINENLRRKGDGYEAFCN